MESFIKGVPAVAGIVNGEREALVEIIVKVTNSSFIKLLDAQITATFFRIGCDTTKTRIYTKTGDEIIKSPQGGVMDQLKVRLNLKHHYFSFHLFCLKVSLSARPIEIEQFGLGSRPDRTFPPLLLSATLYFYFANITAEDGDD